MSHLELPRIDFLLFSLITGKYPALAQTFEVYGYLCEIRLDFKPRTGRNVDVSSHRQAPQLNLIPD